MIREMGNSELFELCETIPKVQCSQRLLFWNPGVIYCTCGHFLVESEPSQKLNKLRLDALSIPHKEEFKRYQGLWYLTLNKSGKNAPMRLRSGFRAAVTIKNRLHQESGEERAEPISPQQYRR